MVVIVNDPERGPVEGNLICHEGKGPCKHLTGNKPGKYSCSIHNKSWYKKTPCFSHGQIERSIEDECRMGRYILNKKGQK